MIKDNMQLSGFNNIKVPALKGHIKLTLHNVHNGKNEVYEGENIVTNAVADMMALNYFGAIDYSKIWGTNGIWKTWYGGVLAYETAHPNLDADKYFPYTESNNHLVAHAGQSSIDVDHDDDLRRGNPTTSSFIITDGSVKQVWEWGTTHGNGNISALSLCHADVGDAGLGSNTYAFQNFNPFAQISNLPNVSINATSLNNIAGQYDDNHSFFFHHGEESDFQIGTVYYSTDKLTVHVRRFPFAKVGLIETYTPTELERVFTVTMPFSTYFLPAYHFDYANKLLWIFNNTTDINQYSTTTVNYCVIDCEAEEITTSGTIVKETDSTTLPPLCCSSGNGDYYDQCRYDYAQILKDGNYIYLPTGTVGRWDTGYAPIVTVTGYKKINVSSQADQSTITFNTGRTVYRSVIKDGGFLVQSGTVVNGNVGYDCVDQYPSYSESDAYYGWSFASPHRQVTYASPRGTGFRTQSVATYILANKLLHTTKYNLPSTIQKTASQSMTIEYVLTEVEPST